MQLISEKKISIELIDNNRIAILFNAVSKKRLQIQMILNKVNMEILFVNITTSCPNQEAIIKCLDNLVGKKVQRNFSELIDKMTAKIGCVPIKNMLKEIFNELTEAEVIPAKKPYVCEICANTDKSYE